MEVQLHDGERLVAHALDGSSGVRVYLFHGLSGDADSDYVRAAAAVLASRGHDVWAVNHRGCGLGRGLAARPYHSGCSADLAATLAAGRADAPDRVHLVVGFSLSGNAALLQAAERRTPLPDGVVAVNPPVDLGATARALDRGFNRLYQLRFVLRLRAEIADRARRFSGHPRVRVPRTATMQELDDLYTAPLGGFTDAEDYYRRCSTLHRLHEVETPTVVVTAADDPFVDPAAYADVRLSAEVLLHVEPHGGHVGYVDAGPRRRWLDGALVHYVEALARARARV